MLSGDEVTAVLDHQTTVMEEIASGALLSAVLDNHLHQGNELNLDLNNITWRRVLDIRERTGREVVEDVHLPAVGEEELAEMRADEPCSAGDEGAADGAQTSGRV